MCAQAATSWSSDDKHIALAEQSVDWKVKLKIWATCTELQAATATTSVIGFIFLSSHNEQKNSDKILF